MKFFPVGRADRRRRFLDAAVLLSICGVVLWIGVRNIGLYPAVFSDEYTYSTDARLLPLSAAAIPDYLYFGIYRVTNLCGDDFLGCARILNLVFFAAGLPFVYLVARRVASRTIAMVVCLFTAASALSTYTAYFMPETLYFFGFWVLAAQALSTGHRDAWWPAWSMGITLGLLTLVKPHALFLLPGIVVFTGLSAWRECPRPALLGARGIALCAVAIAIKFGLGYALAGASALTWFGRVYVATAAASGSASLVGDHRSLVALTLEILAAHAMVLAFLFALPLAVLVTSFGSWRAPSMDGPRWRLAAFIVLIGGSLMVVAAAFTAGVSGQGPYETTMRLHQRYYDFCFPLLIILAAADARFGDRSNRNARVAIACILSIVVLYGVLDGLAPYQKSLIDAPEMYVLTAQTALRFIAAALSISALIAWSASPRHARTLFLLGLMPWMLWKGNIQAARQMRDSMTASVYDEAGLFARRHVPRDETDALRVIGDDASGVYRSLFHIDAAGARSIVVGTGDPVVAAALPTSGEWLVVVGEHPIDHDAYEVTQRDGFLIAHRRRR